MHQQHMLASWLAGTDRLSTLPMHACIYTFPTPPVHPPPSLPLLQRVCMALSLPLCTASSCGMCNLTQMYCRMPPGSMHGAVVQCIYTVLIGVDASTPISTVYIHCTFCLAALDSSLMNNCKYIYACIGWKLVQECLL